MTLLERHFPKLRSTSYNVTSPATPNYNCIAWALGDQENWWWPDAADIGYWPANIPRDETLEGFQQAFESQGFLPCDNAELESGVRKIALYAHHGQPTHAARQLVSGTWSSKLGALEDIEHSLEGLEGEWYGSVVMIFGCDESRQ